MLRRCYVSSGVLLPSSKIWGADFEVSILRLATIVRRNCNFRRDLPGSWSLKEIPPHCGCRGCNIPPAIPKCCQICIYTCIHCILLPKTLPLSFKVWRLVTFLLSILHPRQPQWGGISFRLQLPGKSRLKLQMIDWVGGQRAKFVIIIRIQRESHFETSISFFVIFFFMINQNTQHYKVIDIHNLTDQLSTYCTSGDRPSLLTTP